MPETKTARSARFEIVRGDGYCWARFRATNGAIVWTSEVYTERRTALAAIHQISKPIDNTPWPVAVMVERHGAVEVREVNDDV